MMAEVVKQQTFSPVKSEEDKRPLPFGDRIPKRKPVEGLQFWHKWNADDFVGKYHKAKFANPYMATPGTTIVLEEKRDMAKKADVDRFQGALDARNKARKNRLKVRYETTRLKVDVELKTMIGAPMDDVEHILRDKEEDLRPKKKNPDTQHQIKQFQREARKGNHAYISYAMTMGFKSINYQDPDTGDTALQEAVRRGDIHTTKELLKYCAEPNYRNRLGKSAQHEAWSFWKFHHNRTKEEREAQEDLTYEILRSMFELGGFVDAQDAEGETALHIACRLGPMKVVLLCLAFKGNPNIPTKTRITQSGEEIGGHTPWEYAAIHGRHEIHQLLECWNNIKHQTVLTDFIVVWRKFLKDYEAVITENKEAKKILFELNMEMSVNKVDREEQRAKAADGGVPIDDTLLRQTFKANNEAAAAKPKPWEQREWAEFKEKCEDAGIVGHLSEEEQELLQIKKESLALMAKMSGDDEKKKREAERKKKEVLDMTPAQVANAKLPTIPRKQPRPRTMQSGSRPGSRNTTPGGFGSGGGLMPAGIGFGSPINKRGSSEQNKPSEGLTGTKPPGEEGRSRSPSPANVPTVVTAGEGGEGQERGEGFAGGGGFLNAIDDAQEAWDAENPKEIKDYTSKLIRPGSKVGQRRLDSAGAILMDATFQRYTRRPSTASAILLSVRTPQAPLDGTEEEANPLRYITDQGKEYELMAKQRGKNIRKALGFTTTRPPITPMGDYNTGEALGKLGPRDALFQRLVGKPLSEREAAEEYIKQAMESQNKEAAEGKIADEIDMVNGRARFIEAVAVPPVRKDSAIKQIVQRQRDADHEAKMKKMGLSGAGGEAAMQALQQQMLDEAAGKEPGAEGDQESQSMVSGDSKKKAKKNALKKRMLLRAAKKEVKYGVNRVTSTHNSIGAIEAPWTTVPGRYATRAGDRTR